MQVEILEPTIITMKGDINDEHSKHEFYHHHHHHQQQQQQFNDQDHHHDSNSSSRGSSTTATFTNKYELIKEIGKGSFSKVYLCHERNTQQKYAVKVFKYECIIYVCYILGWMMNGWMFICNC